MVDSRCKMPTRRHTSGASIPPVLVLLDLQHLKDGSLILKNKLRVIVEGEYTQSIQVVGSKIGETTLRQMSFVAHGNVFLHKDEENQEDEDDDIDAHITEPVSEADPYSWSFSHSFLLIIIHGRVFFQSLKTNGTDEFVSSNKA
ncbi:hypothetical protein LR48_Vigan05g120200 [Vigna angularis]|uniref:Uncharacterized protein n=1 Tax=Phaseolus angularis TaxID=3914 RepID=A0A0L9UM13_PHAAN|nr:hypothetical protein LR48_Vigan05g120200 [Vigna angularis]